MPQRSSFREVLGQRAAEQVEDRSHSDFPILLALRAAGAIERPVDIVRILRRGGLSLTRAHSALQRIADGQAETVEVSSDDVEAITQELARLGVVATPMLVPEVNVRRVRERFNLSESDFALRFGLDLDVVRLWEQGLRPLDPSMRTLLAIIEQRPDVVRAVLAPRARLRGSFPATATHWQPMIARAEPER